MKIYLNRIISRQRQCGQTLVLAAMMVLILAFVVFSTMGIAWKTKERIRIQVASDASAYSQAVKVARGFNYFAYSNRSIASYLVSLTILHAYHSEISAAAGLYANLAAIWGMMAVQEQIMVFCGPFGAPFCPEHELHAIEDGAKAVELGFMAGDFNDLIRDLDGPFKTALDGLKVAIQLIRVSQEAVKAELELISSGVASGIDNKMKEFNIPAGTFGGSLMGTATIATTNLFNLNEAFAFSDDADAKRDMTEVTNASLPGWARNRGIFGNTAMFAKLMSKIMDDTDGRCVISQIPFTQGTSGIYDSKPNWLDGVTLQPPDANIEGQGIWSVDSWMISCLCTHNHAVGAGTQPFFVGPFLPASVWSSGDESQHSPDNFLLDAHGDNHDLDVGALLEFERFKIATDGRYNQPVVYKSVSQNLSYNESGHLQAWDIFDVGSTSGGLFGGHIFGKESHGASVQLSSPNEANSVSKTLVYYHHPGNWREPPNFWNPFWRVKLHPWAKGEFTALASGTGEGMEVDTALMTDMFSESDSVVMSGL